MNINSTAGLIPQQIEINVKRDKRYDIRGIMLGNVYLIETRKSGAYNNWEVVTEETREGVDFWGSWKIIDTPIKYKTQTEAIEAAKKLNRELNPEILLEL